MPGLAATLVAVLARAQTTPPLRGEGNQLRLMTVRSEGQFNTVVYEEEDLYRGQDRRDIVLLHPDDLARLGLQPEQYGMSVFRITAEICKQVFPVLLDIENPIFLKGL